MFQATCLLTLLLSASLPAAPLDLYEPSCTYEVQVDTLKASKVSDRRQGRERLGTGAPVIEISSSSIERSGARELHEVLRTLPGLNVKDYGGIGGMKTVSVRGLGANHTSVCVDGMLVNDAQHGSIDLSGFDLDDTGTILVETVSADGIFKPARAFSSGSVISLATKAPDLGAANLLTDGWLPPVGLTSRAMGTILSDMMACPGRGSTSVGREAMSLHSNPCCALRVIHIMEVSCGLQQAIQVQSAESRALSSCMSWTLLSGYGTKTCLPS